MMGELQDRLQKLKKHSWKSCVKKKIVDLEEILTIADLQRKLQHQRSVLASIPSSSFMKSCVEKTEAKLTAAVHLAPAVERAPAPAQEAAQDEVPSVQKVSELQTQVDALQSKVAELSKKMDTSRVSVQLCANDYRTSILNRFKEDILEDRIKLLDFVQSALNKKDAEGESTDEDAPIAIEDTAIEGFERKETDVQVVQEHTGMIVENVDTAHEYQDECDHTVSETSPQVDLVNKSSPVDKSGEANNDDEEVKSEDEEVPDEEIPDEEVPDEETPNEDVNEEEEIVEEGKSEENHPKKKWKKTLRMKILQLIQKRMKNGSDFLSIPKDPPEKSAAGPNVMRSSSSLKPDLKKDKLLRKLTCSRHNPQLPSTCSSVGVCGDQLRGEKLFNSDESFQKKFSGGDYDEGEVIVRTVAKKSEDIIESLGKISTKEEIFANTSLDPLRGNKCVIYLFT